MEDLAGKCGCVLLILSVVLAIISAEWFMFDEVKIPAPPGKVPPAPGAALSIGRIDHPFWYWFFTFSLSFAAIFLAVLGIALLVYPNSAVNLVDQAVQDIRWWLKCVKAPGSLLCKE